MAQQFASDRVFDSEPDYAGQQTSTIQEPGQAAVTITSAADASTATPAPTPTPAATIVAVVLPSTPVPTPRFAPTDLAVPVVTGVARYLASDYARAAKALLPRGLAWSDEPDSVQQRTLLGIGKAFEQSDAVLNGLLMGTLPGNLTSMLPEWEATLGLPDPCLGYAPTIEQRLKQVRGRFVGTGGQSRRHYIDFAAALGFAITITVYKPGQTNLPPSSMPANSDGWMFTWGVTVTAINGSLPADVLMCELEAVKPAETKVLLLSSPIVSPLLNEDGDPLLGENGAPLLNEAPA